MEQFEHLNKNRDYVRTLQEEVGATPDGVYGPATHQKVLDFYESPVIFHMGRVVPLTGATYKVNHDLPLYELADGTQNWSSRNMTPKTICVHWGGLNARHCYRVFNNATGRHVSSHFLVGTNPKTEEFEILQCLDTGVSAYHAGKFNQYSIGIDICMHPHPRYQDKTQKFYPDSYMVDNDHDRVPVKEYMMISDKFAKFCREFLADLRYAVELDDKPICEDNEVYPVKEAAKFSIVGHHNISAKKWDVIPWAEKLYYGL
jgi:hypothetical protein